METESSIWILSSILHQVASIVYRRRKGLVICKLSLVSNIYHGTSLHCALEHVDDTVDMSQIDEMNLK